MATPASITSMKAADVDKLTRRVSELIPIIDERIRYTESRIAGINLQSTVFLAAGAAALTAAFAFEKLSLRIPILVSGIYLFGFGFLMLLISAQQVNRYPFTKATNTWKWFYRNALKDQKAFEFPFWQYIGDWDKLGNRVRSQYDSQLNDFEIQSTTTLLDDRENLWQDIQQVYVLHINEKYKNLFLSHLRTAFTVLAIGFVVVLAAGVCWGQWAEERAHAPKCVSVTQGDINLSYQWRLVNDTTENHVDSADVLIDVSIVNHSDKPLSVNGLELTDKYGMDIPYSTVSGAAGTVVVPPKGSGTYNVAIQIPMALYSSMDRVEMINGK